MFHIAHIPSATNHQEFVTGIYLPDHQTTAITSLAVFLHGRGSDDQALNAATLAKRYPWQSEIQHLANHHGSLIAIPLLGNKAYVDSPIDPKVRQATFLGRELIPWIEQNYSFKHDRKQTTISGFSMGGTGAINTIARYPNVYSVAVNFGGNTDPAFQAIANHKTPPAEDVLGPYPQSLDNYNEWANDHAIDLLVGQGDVALGFGCGILDSRLSWIQKSYAHAKEQGICAAYAEYPDEHHYSLVDMAAQLAMADLLRERLERAQKNMAV